MIHIYHPSKKNTGFAASFWMNKEKVVFATLIKQSGWNEQTQTGSFKGNIDNPEGKTNIKLGIFEVGAILDCIERNRLFSVFHDHDEFPKQIGFSPWMAPDGKQRGYSFAITITSRQDSTYKNSFYIGLTFAEARVIREFLIYALHTAFSVPRPEKKYKDVQETQEVAEAKQVENTKDPLIDF